MIVTCVRCPARIESLTYSESLALWILQCHWWFRHHWGGKKPAVLTDGDPMP